MYSESFFLFFSWLVNLYWMIQLWKSVLFWQKNSCQIRPVCQLQHTWLCGIGYLSDESARKRERNLLSKASDYSILRVRGEGKSRHIPRGQASQIPREENVEMTAEIWELRNPPCSSNCCLETKQHFSFFSSLFSLLLQNLQFSLWFTVRRSCVKFWGWIDFLIFQVWQQTLVQSSRITALKIWAWLTKVLCYFYVVQKRER